MNNKNISSDKLMKVIQDMELPYLRVSLSNECNAKCAFCHNEGQRKENNNSISLQEYREIAKFFVSCFTRVVFTGGEPLLATNLYDVIKVFKSYNYQVGLTTNGILLNENKQKLLLDAGLDIINISLNSLDAKRYYDFYHINKFSVLKKNLAILDIYFKYPNKKINWIVTEKIDFEEEISNLCKLSNESKFIISPIFDIGLDKGKIINLLNKLREKLYSLYGKPDVKEKNENKRHKECLTFSNESIWEFDNLQTEENNFSLKNNNFCKNCLENKNCYEGAYALRLSANGIFKPCLKRTDNNFNLNEIIVEE
jgi:cyclic pyranopterin phosphate synthase